MSDLTPSDDPAWETSEDAAQWPPPRYAPWWGGNPDRWWEEAAVPANRHGGAR